MVTAVFARHLSKRTEEFPTVAAALTFLTVGSDHEELFEIGVFDSSTKTIYVPSATAVTYSREDAVADLKDLLKLDGEFEVREYNR